MPDVLNGCEIGLRERLGIGHPPPELREVQRQRAEHVDDRCPADQVHGASRILALACAEQTIPPAVDQRSADRGDAGAASAVSASRRVGIECQLDTFVSVNTPLGWISFSCVGFPGSSTKRALNPLRPFRLNVVPWAGSSSSGGWPGSVS